MSYTGWKFSGLLQIKTAETMKTRKAQDFLGFSEVKGMELKQ